MANPAPEDPIPGCRGPGATVLESLSVGAVGLVPELGSGVAKGLYHFLRSLYQRWHSRWFHHFRGTS